MSDNSLEFELKVWGSWIENNIHYQGYPRDNILYRAYFKAGAPGRPGHKVLHDCPRPVRRIDKAVRRLTEAEQDAVVLWYCFPINEDNGKRYTKQEYAVELGISYEAFKKRLQRGRQNLKKTLTTV